MYIYIYMYMHPDTMRLCSVSPASVAKRFGPKCDWHALVVCANTLPCSCRNTLARSASCPRSTEIRSSVRKLPVRRHPGCFPMLYYTVLYYTILYYTILYYTILYYTILYHTILYYTILHYTMLCYAIL